MELKKLLSKKLIFLKSKLSSKTDIFKFVAKKLVEQSVINSATVFIKSLEKREKEGPTGLGNGLAVPHCVSSTVNKTAIIFVQLEKEVEWASFDGKPVDLVFLLVSNPKADVSHLNSLATLSKALLQKNVISDLRKASTTDQIISLLNSNASEEKKSETVTVATSETKSKTEKDSNSGYYDIVGITACPTGIAHTYMAKEKLVETAHEMGMTIKIETQGRSGIETRLSKAEVDSAKYIILAHDKALENLDRFNGRMAVDVGTKPAIATPKKLIEQAINKQKLTKIKAAASTSSGGEFTLKSFAQIKANFLGGLSRMLPFVVAGGIMLGIAFLIDINSTGADSTYGTHRAVAGWFAASGKVLLGLMSPILAAYISYSIAGSQGLMPGFLAGMIAAGDSFFYGNLAPWSDLWGKIFGSAGLHMVTGFLGALVGGYIAAFSVYSMELAMRKVSKQFKGLKDIVLIPLSTAVVTALAMFGAVIPLGYLTWGIQIGVTDLAKVKIHGSQGQLMALVGFILGGMMAADLGGPINKIAYAIGIATLDSTTKTGLYGQQELMCSVLVGGMIPPLGIALSTVIFRRSWDANDREAAKANWLLGACFITEGAIPFAVKDPKRVLACGVAGSAIGGAITSACGVKMLAPHGGIFVTPLLRATDFGIPSHGMGMEIGIGVLIFFVALGIGTAIMAFSMGFWRIKDVKSGKLKIDNTKKSEYKGIFAMAGAKQ